MKHLASSFKGENQWWKYLLMLSLIPLLAQITAFLPLVIARILTKVPEGINESHIKLSQPSSYGVDSTIGLALLIFVFICMLIAFVISYKPLHGKSFKVVINGTNTIRWRRILIGFAICFVIEAFVLITDYYMDIDNYELRLNWNRLIPLAVVAFLMIPFQAFYEEIMFRGYITQGVALLTKSRMLVLFVPTILFALMHATNPEVAKQGFWPMMFIYFIIGLSYAIISVLDDGIELAMGLHAANNVFAATFVTTADSVFQTDALLFMKEVSLPEALLPFLLTQVVMIAALAFKYKWPWRSMLSKISIETIEN